MKKIYCCAIVALAAVTMSPSSHAQSGADKIKELSDSVSASFGKMYGYGVSGDLKKGNANLSKEQVIKGLEYAMACDTANMEYIKGLAIGSQLLNQVKQIKEHEGVSMNIQLLKDEFVKAFNSNETVDPRSIQEGLMAQMKKAGEEVKRNSPEAIANAKAEKDYLAKLKKNKKVKFTASGLGYTVLKKGTGANFTESQKIDVRYAGKHLDGTVFDETKTDSVSMSPSNVIPGFKEGMLMMNPGAKYVFYIPSAMAYGVNGAGDRIKPNEMLIFELETIGESAAKEVKKPTRKPGAVKPMPTNGK